jgi:hypothetical protein
MHSTHISRDRRYGPGSATFTGRSVSVRANACSWTASGRLRPSGPTIAGWRTSEAGTSSACSSALNWSGSSTSGSRSVSGISWQLSSRLPTKLA